MNCGKLHGWSMSVLAIVAALGIMSGSPSLSFIGALHIFAVLASVRRLAVPPSKTLAIVVHAVTLLGVGYAVLVFSQARIDSVLTVLLLGVFNRFVLRAGYRDDLLVIGGAAVLVAAATTVSPGIEFLLLVLLFLPSLIWALWTSTLIGSAEGGGVGAVSAVRRRRVPAVVRQLALWGLSLGLLGSLAVAALPRYRFSRNFAPGAFASLPGASNQMDMGVGNIGGRGDQSVMLRVKPADGEALDGVYAKLYSLDIFDGQRWTGSVGSRFALSAPSPLALASTARTLQVTLERVTGGPGRHPIAAIGFTQPWTLLNNYVFVDESGTWMVDRMRARNLNYRMAAVGTSQARRAAVVELRAAERETHYPDDLDPRVIALARRLTNGLATDEEKVTAVLGHFGRGFRYSLDSTPDHPAPLSRFLFETKSGHCEVYASAVAVLLRVVGIRSRIATGFYHGRWNEVGGYQTFSQQDAHAWVEVRTDDRGWRWIDATPQDARHSPTLGFLSQLREWYDMMDSAWYDNIVDFDTNRQKALYKALSDRYAGSIGRLFPADDALDEGGGGQAPPRSSGLLLLLIGPVFVGVLLWLKRRRQSASYLGRRLRRALGEARSTAPSTLGSLQERVPDSAKEASADAIAAYEQLRFSRSAGRRQDVLPKIQALEQVMRNVR